MYTKLPTCIDSLRDSFANTADRQGRVDALGACSTLNDGDTHGIVVEDIRRTVGSICIQLLFRSLISCSVYLRTQRIHYFVTQSSSG